MSPEPPLDYGPFVPAQAVTVEMINDLPPLSAAISAASIFVPNLPPAEDTWLDRLLPDSIHGADTTLNAKSNALVEPAGDNRHTYIAWDLTGFQLAGASTTLDFRLEVSHPDVGFIRSLTVEIYSGAAKPFEEDTATWNNTEPPAGSLLGTQIIAVEDGPAHVEAFNLNTAPANISARWVWLRLLGRIAAGDGATIFSITSKEGAAGPRLDLTSTLI